MLSAYTYLFSLSQEFQLRLLSHLCVEAYDFTTSVPNVPGCERTVAMVYSLGRKQLILDAPFQTRWHSSHISNKIRPRQSWKNIDYLLDGLGNQGHFFTSAILKHGEQAKDDLEFPGHIPKMWRCNFTEGGKYRGELWVKLVRLLV